MNIKTLSSSNTYECSVPDWLQHCLDNSHSLESSDTPSFSPDNDLISRAFLFAYQLHKGQYRKSGEPYINHPIAVAGILRFLGSDTAMVAAGFLHDIIEDTDVTPEELESHFGPEVRHLVEGVTKLSKFNFSNTTERQAENFRRMFLAMAQDIRVIVVKLADRLHNMRTLEFMSESKQRSIALETREIFAPLANRLGIGRLKWELEDLAFKYIEPEAYREIQIQVADRRAIREEKLAALADILRDRMEKAGIRCYEVTGRPKHLYGIYKKMQERHKQFHEIYDIAALRLIVETNEECYRALAIVHDSYRPIPGRFKDYIGLPKPNRYQSLHTGVIGNTGRPVEVQIRTVEMHHIAEYGIAAHWKYKETGGSEFGKLTETDEKFTWLRQLLEWQSDLKDAQEYLDTVKNNLFDEDVYVFTPDGDVMALSNGATTVDFAYRVHSEVGNHCKGAKVNERMVPLDTVLKNGDIVEILTNKNSHPSLDWLNFVRTSTAKNRIRQWYKRSHRDENIARGRELLEKEMGRNGLESLLKSAPMQTVVHRCNYHSVDDLLAALGYGEITLKQVVHRLQDVVKGNTRVPEVSMEQAANNLQMQNLAPRNTLHGSVPTSTSSSKSPIAGVEGLMYHIAGCCNPIPGEPIIGTVTRTRGISIHRQGCHNVSKVSGDRLVPVSWNPTPIDQGRPKTYPVKIQIEVLDRVGVLNDILSRLKDNNINVCSAQVKTFRDAPALIELGIEICDRNQFEQTCLQIKNISDVLNLRRMNRGDQS
ncbi:bifunctional (p)ppGpp synthetase/guanosine-3',5'-bis(diphosphate) 3'-pyrophosphohydrolase [Limnospira fusiformis KN01]|uniref:RelA/SpoT family protein n=1 Tax=Limnospira fusiformis TaxID=54297 RepID=UPI001658B53C|nr:bifunctional (p)ppGpp synthetase/guanosine-3',5'-bis(diphosphate) 3'-pyrophosphohydrolase [Limnospira fusiformis]ULB44107.1 bifunctional (p)ppGpp synthetase/guanosine-3',5'-bis(diphosphate) 3'-pyrophosphohydrolase [Limnospira fusiformis KN01]